MKIILGIKNLKRQQLPTAVAIGVFDGVHIGHRKVLKELVKHARLLRLLPTAVTFEPHPDKVLRGASSVAMLTSLSHRLKLIESLGVKLCLLMHFNRRLARESAKGFFKRVLIKGLNAEALVVGENFSFGRERLKKAQQLKRIASELGLRLFIVGSKRYRRTNISSSHIRSLIERGRLNDAARLLGRPVSILGTVVRGRQRGRVIGFKTANINPHHEAIPPSGVYAAYSRLGSRIYKSVLNIGRRPTFGEGEPTIEVHIFGIDKNLYGKDIEIYFKRRLRPERKFKDKENLRQQIMQDAEDARRILKNLQLSIIPNGRQQQPFAMRGRSGIYLQDGF